MDKRQESLKNLKVCRFCLTTDEELIPLYGNKSKAPKNSVPLALKILACIAIEVFPSDHMPKYICNRCKLFMEISYAFKQICRQADETILQYIQQGSPLTAISWSSQLTKAYKACSKSEMNMVKTVVQGGATVKVMAEECSDSEEGEDDNVYNIKIGDGSEEGKSIKIITTVDKQEHVAKGRQIKQNTDDEETIEPTIVQGCWPCDECECNYPLEQLLTLHKAQKHRSRSEVCEECDGRFYNKYDLEIHRATHATDLPFQCVVCSKKFKRLILLKRHEKTMHSECPQLSCRSCPASFLSPEELEVHQLKHDRSSDKPFACFCGKSFINKQILVRHTAMVHHKKSAFSCQYCPEQFPSIAKLTRHVREHAGEKPYPCKYCDKNFTKSHHYTRHLRLKHSNTIAANSVYTEGYSCDECSEKFATQDELMYHSALHATRNLTCPLCQEKFDDVDTVTTHIKSHVTGTEFMCDFCELIFTTKEKLDAHLAKMHEDELIAMEQETEPDESSMDLEADEEDEDASLDVKEQNGEMVVEIKKPDEYMLPAQPDEDKGDITQSEDSEMNYTEMTSTELEIIPIAASKQAEISYNEVTITKPAVVTPLVVSKSEHVNVQPTQARPTQVQPTIVKSSPILRRAEDVKRKAMVLQQTDKKDKPKVESSTPSSGTSDKSLRLLEKELQDLKRTNSRTEAVKTPARAAESLRTRRPQLFASTPKNRNGDKKESILKPTPEKTLDKKQPERKANTKEPKEKSNNNTSKDDRELKGSKEERDGKVKEDAKGKEESRASKEEIKGKEEKETRNRDEKQKEEKKDTKNTSESAATPAEDSSVRRSTRPSKVKDYAKMIRDSSLNSDEEDDTDAEDQEEDYKEDKTLDVSQSRGRGRGRIGSKPPLTPATKPGPPASKGDTPLTAPRKRGRPRKEPKPEVPSKIKKDEPTKEGDADASKGDVASSKEDAPKENQPDNAADGANTPDVSKQSEPRPGVIMSPSGQTLKKVPIKALPPGVKALPLPGNSARLGGGEVTEMQIGKKIVKVQKIVMTKAEVEAMTKKGLLEIKDGTMVLKQGIKLPTSDPVALKTSLAAEGEQNKVCAPKQDKPPAAAAPTRSDDA